MNDKLPLPRLTWRDMMRVNSARLFGDLRAAFANTSPLVTRAFLAIATLLAAGGLWFSGDEWTQLDVFDAMRVAMPRWSWALLFTLAAIGQWWRLLDDTPRFGAGVAINTFAAAMWLLVTIEFAISSSPFVFAGPAVVALQAMWVAVRTGVTNLDRRRA